MSCRLINRILSRSFSTNGIKMGLYDFNTTHPELKDNEYFMANFNVTSYHNFHYSETITTRIGKIAYTFDGKIIKEKGLFPVFGIIKNT